MYRLFRVFETAPVQNSSSTSSKVRPGSNPPPAALYRMSRLPWASTIPPTMRSASALFVRSPGAAVALPPASLMRWAVSSRSSRDPAP